MSHQYTDETGTKWPFPCDLSDSHEGSCDGGEWAPGRYPAKRRPEGSCGILSDRQDCFDWCPLEYAHHGPHEYTSAWSPLPRPIRRHRKVDLLGCLVYLVVIISGIYLIGQGVRAIL